MSVPNGIEGVPNDSEGAPNGSADEQSSAADESADGLDLDLRDELARIESLPVVERAEAYGAVHERLGTALDTEDA